MKSKLTYYLLSFIVIPFALNAQNPAPLVRYCGFNVTTGEVEIRWEESTAANVAYYQVWFYYPPESGISSGWIQIDGNIAVGADRFLSFDPNSLNQVNPLNEPVIVGIQAHNASDISLNSLNENVFDSTIYLQANHDSCLALVDLQWTQYNFKQWPQPGTTEYHVYISNDNGANYTLESSLPVGSTSHQILNLDENQDYIIYISAISENTPGDIANSNLVYINTDMSIIPRYMYANYATYHNGMATISFSIDPLSETSTYNVLRSSAPAGPYDSIYQYKTLEKELQFEDFTDYQSGPYYYKLEVINNCNFNIRETENMASTILFSKNDNVLSPTFIWNNYLQWTDGVSYYSLERKFGNSDFEEIATISDSSFTDSELESLVENNYAIDVCYQLTAYENNGVNTSLANPVCYELPPNIRFEFDAFMPGSGTENDTFGPTIDFLPQEYKFKVIDRKGMVVYESSNPEDTRWDGYINNQLAPLGAYMCIVQYRVGNSRKQTIHGAVSVVY